MSAASRSATARCLAALGTPVRGKEAVAEAVKAVAGAVMTAGGKKWWQEAGAAGAVVVAGGMRREAG